MTKIEILQHHLSTPETPNIFHLDSKYFEYIQVTEDVYDAMQQYANHQCSGKDKEIAELKRGLKHILEYDNADSWYKLEEVFPNIIRIAKQFIEVKK